MMWRIAVVILLLAGGIPLWYVMEPLLRFSPVTAQILSTRIEHRTSNGSPGGRMRVGGRTRGVRGSGSHSGYVPVAEYRYDVGGTSFVSDQYSRLPTLESSKAARAHLRKLLPGTTVTAWYDPASPGEAVLSRAPNPILLTIIAVMGLFCWLFSLAARRVRPAGQPASCDATA